VGAGVATVRRRCGLVDDPGPGPGPGPVGWYACAAVSSRCPPRPPSWSPTAGGRDGGCGGYEGNKACGGAAPHAPGTAGVVAEPAVATSGPAWPLTLTLAPRPSPIPSSTPSPIERCNSLRKGGVRGGDAEERHCEHLHAARPPASRARAQQGTHTSHLNTKAAILGADWATMASTNAAGAATGPAADGQEAGAASAWASCCRCGWPAGAEGTGRGASGYTGVNGSVPSLLLPFKACGSIFRTCRPADGCESGDSGGGAFARCWCCCCGSVAPPVGAAAAAAAATWLCRCGDGCSDVAAPAPLLPPLPPRCCRARSGWCQLFSPVLAFL